MHRQSNTRNWKQSAEVGGFVSNAALAPVMVDCHARSGVLGSVDNTGAQRRLAEQLAHKFIKLPCAAAWEVEFVGLFLWGKQGRTPTNWGIWQDTAEFVRVFPRFCGIIAFFRVTLRPTLGSVRR